MSTFTWTGWEAETDLDNPDDREGVYFLTINRGDEEFATIIHRTVGGKYPLDGAVATKKIERAEFMCDAMNKYLQDLGG